MLKKLIKHEWIATAGRFGIFYLILFAITLFTSLISLLEIDSIVFTSFQGFLFGIYVITLIGVWFCSIGLIIVRFYKNMVSDEGYLTFTLPAKVEELVLAKFVVALFWQLVTMILIALSLFCVMLAGPFSMGVGEILQILPEIMQEAGWVFGVLALCFSVSAIYQIFLYYLSIAIGQLFLGHKIIGSVAGYCIINFAVQIVSVVFILVLGIVVGFTRLDAFMNTTNGITLFVAAECVLMLILAAVEYVVTCTLLKKKLNLN